MTKQRKNKKPQKRTKRTKQKQLDIYHMNGFPRFLSADPFPPHITKELTYSSNDSITSAVGTFGTSKIFGLNCLFDPDISGTGHQPYGFDQLCASAGPYTRYKVLGVRVKVTFISKSTANGNWVCAALHQVGSSATIVGLNLGQVAEKHNTRTAMIPNTGAQSKEFTFNFANLHDLYNFTKLQFDADNSNTTGPYNGNPALIPRLEIAIVNSSSLTESCEILTQITYRTRFYSRAQLAQS